MTTDTRSKEAAVSRDGFTVGGMAKGAGMIHPVLATMLAVVTTDYPLGPGEATGFLRPAVDESFNRISIDGECSTNDAVVLLANGASGVSRDATRDESFRAALREVCADLSTQIVSDGEGATVVLEIAVTGATNDSEATAIARRIATSPLVKTAAVRARPELGARARRRRLRHLERRLREPRPGPRAPRLQRHHGLRARRAARRRPGPLRRARAGSISTSGSATARPRYLTSDLSYDYVRINAEYTT